MPDCTLAAVVYRCRERKVERDRERKRERRGEEREKKERGEKESVTDMEEPESRLPKVYRHHWRRRESWKRRKRRKEKKVENSLKLGFWQTVSDHI